MQTRDASSEDLVEGQFALSVALTSYVLSYVLLFVIGYRAFVFKTVLFPAFLAYAWTLRDRWGFIRDWLPFLAGVVAFDFCRGGIYLLVERGFLHPHFAYPLTVEYGLLHTSAAPIILQRWRTPMWDVIAVAFHGSHFLFFLLFGLVLWHSRRDCFNLYRLALLLVMALGLIGYAALPTAPPWLAAEAGWGLHPIAHVVTSVYNASIPSLTIAFDTNPVAAMPSLHAAFPVACALIGNRCFSTSTRMLLWTYASGVMLSAIYLGEHYAIDVIAGALVAWVSVEAALRLTRLTRRKAAYA